MPRSPYFVGMRRRCGRLSRCRPSRRRLARRRAMPAKKPPPVAIAALREDPSRAYEFDGKYGAGSAHRVLTNNGDEIADLLRQLIMATKKNGELLEELIEHTTAPRRVLYDKDGNVCASLPT